MITLITKESNIRVNLTAEYTNRVPTLHHLLFEVILRNSHHIFFGCTEDPTPELILSLSR